MAGRAPLRSYGLDVLLSGDAAVVTKKAITVIPLFVFGGTIDLRSRDGSVTVLSTLHASDIDISAGGDVRIEAVVSVRPPARSGGTIDITSTGGNGRHADFDTPSIPSCPEQDTSEIGISLGVSLGRRSSLMSMLTGKRHRPAAPPRAGRAGNAAGGKIGLDE